MRSGPLDGEDRSRTLFINGSYGVGKSRLLEAVGARLARAARPFSLMDVDWFHRSWPTGADDPDNVVVEASNLRAVWRNFESVGPRQLVVSGVIASSADRARYEEVFGQALWSVRLEASPSTIERRLRRRYDEDQTEELEWHLQRYRTLRAALEAADSDEYRVETDSTAPDRVALTVLREFDRAG